MARKPGFRSQAHRDDDKWLGLGLILFIAALTLVAHLLGYRFEGVDNASSAVLLFV